MNLDNLIDHRAKLATEIDGLLASLPDDHSEWTEEQEIALQAKVDERKALDRRIDLARTAEEDAKADWLRRRGLKQAGEFAEGAVAEFDDGARIEVVDTGGPFRTLGEQLAAIARAGMPGGSIDERLHAVAAASGMQSAVGADGGFLIQKDFTTRMLARAAEMANLWERCDRVPIGENADGLEAPYVDETSRATGSRWGGVRVYRKGEADTVTASRPKIGKWQRDLEDLMGLAYATDRSLRDATSLGAILERAFESEFAWTVDSEVFEGDGVGRCLGYMASDALVTVAKESGQAADTVVAANITKMYARMPAGLKGGAVWFINSDVLPQLMLLTLGDSPMFIPPGRIADAPGGLLLGRPIVEIEQAATVGDLGDITFANLDEFCLIEKGGIQSDTSIHVRFLYNERAFRWVLPINGAPKWKTSQTPAKGSAAKSPFVALAART